MLMLKPNCECCDVDLPPDAANARICTFECTFCAECADTHFNNICPNCGGEQLRRPIRTAEMLVRFPASPDRFVKNHAACKPVERSQDSAR
jgi:hypothetical protein